MADIRINALPTTATDFASDDYIAIDGTTNGTRKLNAKTANLTFSDVTLGTSGPSVKSSLSARAPRQGLVFDGTAGATVASVAAFGTGDFTVDCSTSFASASGDYIYLGGASNSFTLIQTGGQIGIAKTGGAITYFSYTPIASKFVRLTVTRSGTTWKLYANGVLQDTQTTSLLDFTVASTTIGKSGSNTYLFNGFLSPLIYNRALSASEVVALYEAGAPSGADYNNASSTSTVTGDSSTFTSGVGSWFPWGAGTITASAGVGNVTSGATTDNGDYLAAQLSLSPAAFTNLNKRYRITLTLGSVTGGTVTVRNLTSSGTKYATGLTTGTHVIDTGLITGQQNFGLAASAAGVTFTVDNITVVPLGLLLAPDAAQAGGGLTWYDTSGNAANITLPASGVSWNVPTSGYLGGNWTTSGNLTVSGGTTTIIGSAPALALKRSSDNSLVGYIDATTTGTLRLYGGVGGSNTLAASFPQTGNVLIGTTSDGGQKLQVNGTAAISGGIVGTTTNDNAAAGIVGEYVSSTVGAGSAITLTTATAANLTSITLTPGDWDVVFVPHFWGAGGSVTGTQCVSSLSTTSATLDTTPDRLAQFPSVPTSGADLTVVIPATRFSVTSSTIIYGVVRSTFTVGTNKVYGVLSARRVR